MKTILSIVFFLCVNYVFGQAPVKVPGKPAKDEGKCFTIVEQMPQFPGGQKEMNKFLAGNFHYPVDTAGKKGENTVYITFIIDKDSSLTNIKILRGLNEALDSDVMRVIKLMPKWIPGKQNGRPVSVQYNLPIKFALK